MRFQALKRAKRDCNGQVTASEIGLDQVWTTGDREVSGAPEGPRLRRVTRLLLAAPADAPGAEDSTGHGTDHLLARLARALRDAGHEVVHAGQGGGSDVLVDVAIQEDVEVVVLLAAGEYDVSAVAGALAGDGPAGADEQVQVVVATAGEEPRSVVRRVADATSYRSSDGG